MKKLLLKIGSKGVFNTIFPKAENTKIGQAVSGLVNGTSSATPLSFFQEFAISFFDTNKDGEVTIEDFAGMSTKTFFMGLGFLIAVGLLIGWILGA
jgi:hypothetical protein